ncbi:MAG: LPS export ABC transporter permease LptG [Deltaproteobacteria bacterium]|nr:LPS export ABC transporter permease LptG [Deltaproteobacteria bacterium]
MTIISRYIIQEFNKIFFYSLAVAASLFFIIELFERLDVFVKYHASLLAVCKYFVFKFPFIFLTVAPIAVLLATFITLGILARNFEIVALRASGVSLFHVAVPILTYALITSFVSLIGNELITPYANRKAKSIYSEIRGRKGKYLFRQHQLWYRGDEAIYNIRFFSHHDNKLQGVTIYFVDHDFHLSKRVDAKEADWDKNNNQWVFLNVTTRTFTADQKIETSFHKQAAIPLKETPETFKQEIHEPEEMSYQELKQYIEKTIEEGYDTTQYRADMYAKLSRPFINLVIALLGIPFALHIGRRGGFAAGVTLSFSVGFFFWVFFNICLALGYSGEIHPLISAWIANLTFGAIGLWMLLQTRH